MKRILSHEVLTHTPVERVDDARRVHLQLMRECTVGGGDEQDAAVKSLRAAERRQAGADHFGEREAQPLLAHLAANAEAAQRRVDEIARDAPRSCRRLPSVTTPPRTE